MAPVLELRDVAPSLSPEAASAFVSQLVADYERDPRAVLFEWCSALLERIQVWVLCVSMDGPRLIN